MASILLRSGKVFDGLGDESLDGLEVLLEDERMKEVSDTAITASSAQVVDLRGRTLVPGLIDAHFHAIAADPDVNVVEQMPLH